MGGVTAKYLKKSNPWTYYQPYKDGFERCESLKKEMGLSYL